MLEARDRVGGRVWSRELANGAVVEMGAEFVLPGNDTLRSYVERFGLGFWDKGMRYGSREPRGGEPVDSGRDGRRADRGRRRRTRCCARRVGGGAARPPRDRRSCTRGDPFPARGLVWGDRRPRRRGRARGDRSPLGRPVPERGGRESAHRARARAHTRAGRAPLEPGRARSLERQWGRRLRGRGRGRGRPRRARRAPERDRPDRLRAARCRRRFATPTPPSSSVMRRSSSCRSPRPRRRAPSSPCPSAGGAGRRPAPTGCSRS